MNGFAQYPPANGQGGPQSQQRSSLDMVSNGSRIQAERNGALPMPVGGAQRPFGGMSGEVQGYGPMGMPRSPPKNKNTQHVPCKFYLQGTCQAGRTCPFSHDVESTTRPAPCKYFAKGGCKFGRKCALLHVTPDGTIINRGPPFPPGPPFPGAQQPGVFPQPPGPGLLSMQAQGLDQRPNGDMPADFDNYQYGPRNGYDVPQIDMTYASASPQYGSPPQERQFGRSPPSKGLSVLDAPLPNSFDSNGISMAARYGPMAASLPPRFGVDSPPSSLPRTSKLGNTAIRDLQSAGYERGMDGVLAGSSPPSGPDEPLTFPKRPLHSERLRAPRNQMISASLGTKLPTQSFEYSDDEDNDPDREEDLLPASLRDLIPDGKSRRESRSRTEDENTPASFLAAQRRTISGHATPQESKVGSPQNSPSRYTGVWGRTQSSGEMHMGSPLRNSGFNYTASTSRTNGDLSPTVSSPPRQASMSMLTQELQRTKLDNKLDAARSQAAASSVGMSRTLSNGSTGRTSLDRTLSGRGRDKIDEEQDLFDMDELGDHSKTAPRPIASNESRRGSAWDNKAAFGTSPGNGDSGFGAIGSNRTK